MEAWVAEQNPCSESMWLEIDPDDSPTSSSYIGTNLRTESVDSGVETASSDTSFPATSASVSTDTTDADTTERECDRLTPSSAVESALLSSPVCPNRDQGRCAVVHPKLERALQRVDSQQLKNKPEALTADGLLRRQPKRHKSDVVRGQPLEGFGVRRTVNPSVPVGQMCRGLPSCNKQLLQTHSEVRYCLCHQPNCGDSSFCVLLWKDTKSGSGLHESHVQSCTACQCQKGKRGKTRETRPLLLPQVQDCNMYSQSCSHV